MNGRAVESVHHGSLGVAPRVRCSPSDTVLLDCPSETGEQPVSTYDAMVFLVGIPMMMAVCLVALTVVRRAV
jgi:hypothetical protein